MTDMPEVWLRGPVAGIPPVLQPVAHSLLQSLEEVKRHLTGLAASQIWTRPGGAGSAGFHVRHAAGSLDRLFTYARGEQLSSGQMADLRDEGPENSDVDAAKLIAAFETAVDRALQQLRATQDTTLLEGRGVGRAQLPSTALGLLFHAAEHTQRHMGQMATICAVVVSGGRPTS
ncbi:MAG: DinB family protein [Acidobacteria bacterium]|nr:DinB family protein [Acidobacteriota bacterium]